jgi:opacity protein-like surface antigen
MFGGSLNDHDDVTIISYSDPKYEGGGSFNAGLLFGYDYGLLALQTELLLTGDNMGIERTAYYSSSYGYSSIYSINTELSTMTFQIPILLKLDLHWGRLMLQPLAGLYLNFGLGEMDYELDNMNPNGNRKEEGSIEYESPLFGMMVGGALGVRIGRGYIFLDIRYAKDLGKTELADWYDGTRVNKDIKWTRSATMLNLGYQYYFK